MTEPARAVRHSHFSSKFMMSMSMDSSGMSFCSSCKKLHSKNPTERIKLCLTDSTLHRFFVPPEKDGQQLQYEGDKEHVDYVSIPGGKVEDLLHAFRVEYENETRAIDVLVVAGLNNILRGDKVEELVTKFDRLRRHVMWQAEHHHPDTQNTFAVATLLYAPQLCWLPDDGPLPSPTYKNRLEEMKWLTTTLLNYNEHNGVPSVPHVHKFGIRIDNRSSRDIYGNVEVRHRTCHKWEQWREDARDRMLHLDDQRRLALGRAVNKYFVHNT